VETTANEKDLNYLIGVSCKTYAKDTNIFRYAANREFRHITARAIYLGRCTGL
jgi:hypothetical protein